MTRIPSVLLGQTATVRSFTQGPTGPVYGDPVEIRCRVEAGRRVVRDSDGTEVVAEKTLYCRPDVKISAEDEVTVDGRTTHVIAVKPRHGLRKPSHLEVNLA